MSESSYIDLLDRICVNGVCHCDWRLTLRDCVEAKAMTIVYGINIGLSALSIIVGTSLLIHRVVIKGHRLYESDLSKGCFRPKPIDCMLLFFNIYNVLRLISSVVLITDVCKDMITRAFIFELPWQFGFGSFALYLIGIAQTLADSHRVIANSWLPSARTVDFIGSLIFLGPFFTNNAMSLAAGIMASKNIPLAIIFTRLLYCFWFVHCLGLSIAVFFAGYRLTRILRSHLEKFNTSGPRYVSVQTGIIKIRIVMAIIVACLMSFAIFLLCWGVLRNLIMVNTVGSVILGTIWNLLGAVTTFGVEFAIVFNPKVDDPTSLGLKSSSNEKSGSQTAQLATFSNYSTHEYSGTNSNPNGAQGTLSHNAFDELKLQQLQYQKVFQKHNQHNAAKNTVADIKVSAAGIPIEDAEYFNDKRYNSEKNYSIDDERVLSDGADSQIDLVGYASKN